MAAARGSLSFDMDKEELEALNGFVHTINAGTKTDRYLGPLLQRVHAEMSDMFGNHMDSLARAHAGHGMKSPYHHVYEWEMQGIPQGRLWSDRLEGHGGNRWATFNWRASKRTVPVPPDELGPNAPYRKFRKIHVFVWKAMVMEFKDQVKIEPKNGTWLGWESNALGNVEGLEFSKGPIYINPGGGNTVGSFTATFAEWWTGQGAEETFNREIRYELERDFKRGAETALKKGTRSRQKTLSISAMKPPTYGVRGTGRGFERGSEAAEKFLTSQVRDYNAQARARRDNLKNQGGDEE